MVPCSTMCFFHYGPCGGSTTSLPNISWFLGLNYGISVHFMSKTFPSAMTKAAFAIICWLPHRWKEAFALLVSSRDASLRPSTVSFSVVISAAEKGRNWLISLQLMQEAGKGGQGRVPIDLHFDASNKSGFSHVLISCASFCSRELRNFWLHLARHFGQNIHGTWIHKSKVVTWWGATSTGTVGCGTFEFRHGRLWCWRLFGSSGGKKNNTTSNY